MKKNEIGLTRLYLNENVMIFDNFFLINFKSRLHKLYSCSHMLLGDSIIASWATDWSNLSSCQRVQRARYLFVNIDDF